MNKNKNNSTDSSINIKEINKEIIDNNTSTNNTKNKNNNLINQRSIIIANPSFDLKKSNLKIEKNNKRNLNSIFSRFKWNSLEGTKKEGESINKIIDSYNKIDSLEKLILTTEKDAVRLIHYENYFKGIDIVYLPVNFKFQGKTNFNELILKYVEQNRVDSKVS